MNPLSTTIHRIQRGFASLRRRLVKTFTPSTGIHYERFENPEPEEEENNDMTEEETISPTPPPPRHQAPFQQKSQESKDGVQLGPYMRMWAVGKCPLQVSKYLDAISITDKPKGQSKKSSSGTLHLKALCFMQDTSKNLPYHPGSSWNGN
ncbi:unnamed protein product [Orchesella dallaii]|uniref:Uncharacterized protein n=1 Tax=Orchesella dallaii TaxID=48710 RepID=A0ABP1QJQ1_9HEXA